VPIVIAFRSVQRVYFDDLDALDILHDVRFLLFMSERLRSAFAPLVCAPASRA
jgi:acyl-CoA thioesterase FadM